MGKLFAIVTLIAAALLALSYLMPVVQIFFVRDGKLIGRDHFFMRAGEGDSEETVLQSFIKQYYMGTPFIPKEFLKMSRNVVM